MYMPLAFIAFGIAMPVLGLIPSTALTIQSIQPFYFCVSGLVAVFSMVYRTGAVEKSRQAALVQLQLAEQETQLERDRVRTQNQLLSMLSHELKTPLSVMRMAIGWLSSKPDIHNKARAAVQDMNEVINRVLLLNKIQGNSVVLQQEKIPLRDAIRQAISLHPQSESQRIRFDVQCEADVLADPLLLKTVLRNVIDNALRYSPAGSNVEVVMQEQMRHTRGVAVSVRNQLLGEDRPDTAKLFTQFYRSAGAQHQTGSGLGLFISKELMVQMSGDLTFEEDAPWVAFTLWLPL
jgi:signal transduction histidine kinase